MKSVQILTAGQTQALSYARERLAAAGYSLTDKPSSSVTHLLLPVPSFAADGSLNGGGDLSQLLSILPQSTCIIGGNLNNDDLGGRTSYDLLKDPYYLACNARITAYCALTIAAQALPQTMDQTKTLVIGWGRIGKCLTQLLYSIGSQVTVAARKETDRATAKSLGYHAIHPNHILAEDYHVIFNTAPQLVISNCNSSCLKIDLASRPGISGSNIIWARGLPNKYAPKSSGRLIADCVAAYLKETETQV